MTSEPIDPADVMARHSGHRMNSQGSCIGAEFAPRSMPTPCEPYRLAEALAYANGERDAEVYRLTEALAERDRRIAEALSLASDCLSADVDEIAPVRGMGVMIRAVLTQDQPDGARQDQHGQG